MPWLTSRTRWAAKTATWRAACSTTRTSRCSRGRKKTPPCASGPSWRRSGRRASDAFRTRCPRSTRCSVTWHPSSRSRASSSSPSSGRPRARPSTRSRRCRSCGRPSIGSAAPGSGSVACSRSPCSCSASLFCPTCTRCIPGWSTRPQAMCPRSWRRRRLSSPFCWARGGSRPRRRRRGGGGPTASARRRLNRKVLPQSQQAHLRCIWLRPPAQVAAPAPPFRLRPAVRVAAAAAAAGAAVPCKWCGSAGSRAAGVLGFPQAASP
mmetsp:Transcript_113190/g.365972  ORF Transcript_113190/g.365972 Transcript_113190/m.365972 type:complete len:265 (+) Transcript_113190:553-1347(+)